MVAKVAQAFKIQTLNKTIVKRLVLESSILYNYTKLNIRQREISNWVAVSSIYDHFFFCFLFLTVILCITTGLVAGNAHVEEGHSCECVRF